MFDFLKNSIKKDNNLEQELKIKEINELLEAFRKNKISFYLNPQYREVLSLLCSTKDWYLQIEQEDFDKVYNLYIKWQNSLNNKYDNNSIVKVKELHGFDERDTWNGTVEEYLTALKNNEINEQTKVNIIKYSGEVLLMNNEGDIIEDIDDNVMRSNHDGNSNEVNTVNESISAENTSNDKLEDFGIDIKYSENELKNKIIGKILSSDDLKNYKYLKAMNFVDDITK